MTVVSDRPIEVLQAPSVTERLERLRRFRGRMPKGYRFTRADACER